MRLKARDRLATSSSAEPSCTRVERSPPRTRSAATISRPIGRASWLASTRPISTAAISTSSAAMAKIITKVICRPERLRSSSTYCATALLDGLLVRQHRGVERAADQQHPALAEVERHQRPHPLAAGQHRDLAEPRLGDRLLARRVEGEGGGEAGVRDHALRRRVEHHRFRQVAQRGVGGEHAREGDAAVGQQHAGARQVGGHGERVAADGVAVLLQVAAAGLEARLQRGAHPVAEPGLDAEVEEHRREDRDQQRRHHRHAAEQQHQPDMQARAGGAAPALRPHPHQPRRRARRRAAAAPTGSPARSPPPCPGGAARRGCRWTARRRWRCRAAARRARGRASCRARAAVPPPAAAMARGVCAGAPAATGGGAAVPRRRGGGRAVAARLEERAAHHAHQPSPRTTGRSSSRIFLRRVLRFRPSMAAALIWLPRVADSTRRSSGRSTSASTRS